MKRHIEEKHYNVKIWKCSEKTCESTFVRRYQYGLHLEKVHKFNKTESITKAVKSSSQGQTKPSATARYTPLVEHISDDDSVLDLVNELDNLNEMEFTNENADTM